MMYVTEKIKSNPDLCKCLTGFKQEKPSRIGFYGDFLLGCAFVLVSIAEFRIYGNLNGSLYFLSGASFWVICYKNIILYNHCKIYDVMPVPSDPVSYDKYKDIISEGNIKSCNVEFWIFVSMTVLSITHIIVAARKESLLIAFIGSIFALSAIKLYKNYINMKDISYRVNTIT